MSDGPGFASFIVRLSVRDGAGRLSGIVERVRTGEKERFEGVEDIGRVIARMVKRVADIQDPQPKEESQ
jgi:hypothetical protein